MSGEPAEFFFPLILPLKSIIKQRYFLSLVLILLLFFFKSAITFLCASVYRGIVLDVFKKRMLNQSNDPIIHPSFHLSIYSPTHPAPFMDGVFMKAAKLNFGDSFDENESRIPDLHLSLRPLHPLLLFSSFSIIHSFTTLLVFLSHSSSSLY